MTSSSDAFDPTPQPIQPRPGEKIVNSRQMLALLRSRHQTGSAYFRKHSSGG